MTAAAHSAVGRRWPRAARNPRAVQRAVGLTLTSLYTFEEASGNLADVISGLNLSAAGSPVYGGVVGGKRGITFNSAVDGFSSDVHDIGLASAIFVHVGHHTTTPDSFVFGRATGDSATCAHVAVATPAAGKLRAIVNALPAALTLLPDMDVRGKTVLTVLQIDRAAGTARMYLKERGGPDELKVGSIGTHGTFSAASQSFGVNNYGGVTSQTGGFTSMLLGVATGTQCEGANVAARIAGGMRF